MEGNKSIMPTLIIDATALIPPPVDESIDVIISYLEKISTWNTLQTLELLNIITSNRTVELLKQEGLSLILERFNQLVSKTNDRFSINDIWNITSYTVSSASYFEEIFKITNICATNIIIRPYILMMCDKESLRENLSRCTIILSILRKYYINLGLNQFLGIYKNNISKITISCNITNIINTFENKRDIQKLPSLPTNFKGDLLVYHDCKSFFRDIDESSILKNASCDDDAYRAIYIAYLKHDIESIDIYNLQIKIKFKIGSYFLQSINNHKLPIKFYNKILKNIIEILLYINLADSHKLRTDKSGNSPQKIRQSDGAKAWRRSIDTEFRLHYWISEKKPLEFACLNHHEDFTIKE
jgi:hypothetical protein